MTGAALELDAELRGLDRLQQRLDRFADPSQRHRLLKAIGAEVESQTHRRLRDEKESPEGDPWEPWSEAYATSRHSGQSLLMGEGDLDDSIQFLVEADQVEIGSNLVYAAIHHFGGEEVGMPIPARPWLGLSEENLEDVLDVMDDWATEQLER